MQWLLEHFGTIVFLLVAFSFVRSLLRAAKLSTEHKSEMTETEEQRRVREIQERIRRKVAERRGGATAAELQPPVIPARREPVLPAPRPATVPPVDPFGGPMRRLMAELERKVAEQSRPVAAAAEPTEAALVERQEQLAAELRSLEESRALAQRRAAQARAASKADTESGVGMRAAGREELLAALRNPTSLRQAVLLREILGAPVALR